MDSNIKDIINSMPEAPGIYKMLDAKGDIIYIGKSKCLKKRVKSYFVVSPRWEKARKAKQNMKVVRKMFDNTGEMESLAKQLEQKM